MVTLAFFGGGVGTFVGGLSLGIATIAGVATVLGGIVSGFGRLEFRRLDRLGGFGGFDFGRLDRLGGFGGFEIHRFNLCGFLHLGGGYRFLFRCLFAAGQSYDQEPGENRAPYTSDCAVDHV